MLLPLLLLYVLEGYLFSKTNSGLPLFTPMVFLPIIVLLPLFTRMQLIEAKGVYCSICGYILRGCSGEVCPECGVEHHLTQAETSVDRKDVIKDVVEFPMAYVARDGIGVAWSKTEKMVLSQPGSVMAAVEDGMSVGCAWGFALISLWAGLLFYIASLAIKSRGVGFLYYIADAVLISEVMSVSRNNEYVALLSLFVMLFIGLTLGLFFWILTARVLLGLTGGCGVLRKKTAEALLYSCAVLPAIGLMAMIGGIWWMIVAAVMIRSSHQVGTLRATIAVVVFPIFVVFCATAHMWL